MAETYTYKADHAEDSGNSYSIGVTDARATTATRVGYFYSDGGSEVGLKQAADAAYGAAGPVHPSNATLALKGARAGRVAPNIVRVELYYNGRMGVNSGKPSVDVVRSDSGFMTFKTWHRGLVGALGKFDLFGRPCGDLNFLQKGTGFDKDRSHPPQPIYIQVPIQIIRVPALVDADPSDTNVDDITLVEKLGTLNGDPITWAGVERPPGSLQFQRFWVEPVVINDVVKFRVEYTFGYKLSHWVQELPPVWDMTTKQWVNPTGIDGDGEADNEWYSFIAPQQTFTAAFPLQP